MCAVSTGCCRIPVPAVTKIATAHGLKYLFLPVEGELVTPHRRGNRGGDSHIGYAAGIHKDSRVRHGAGKRSPDVPEILRVFWWRRRE